MTTANKIGADVIVHGGRIATQDQRRSFATAVAIKDGRFLAVGTGPDVMAYRDGNTHVIDVGGRTVIPGLNDSHLHIIRGGLNYNMELRWDGVPSLADALRMLKEQVRRTTPPQWVRVVGGWTEFQFAERRMPTLEEINAVSPDTPVFVLHLYDRAILSRAALRACGYTKDTANPPGGEMQRDKQGNPTGLPIARPNAMILYAPLAKGPKLPPDQLANSTRHFMREMNRLGLTSAIDAGGGFQNYPDDYKVIEELNRRGEMTVRIAYNLFTQRPKQELDDFSKWVQMTRPGEGSDYYRMNGAGDLLTPPKGTIKPKLLLLIGLGDEDLPSLERMERVGRVALREAGRVGVKRAAFAPLIRDQGNSKFGTGEVAQAIMKGILLAYDTEKRLHKERLAKPFTLEEWVVEEGADYFDDTLKGVQLGIEKAKAEIAKRTTEPYGTTR